MIILTVVLFGILPLILPYFFALLVLVVLIPISLALEKIFNSTQLMQAGWYSILVSSWLLLVSIYYFLTRYLSDKNGPLSIPLVTFISLISSLLSFNTFIIICSLTSMESSGICDPKDYYNVLGVIKFSIVPLTSYLAFLIAKIVLLIKKKESLKKTLLFFSALAITASVLALKGNIMLLMEMPKILDKYRAKKMAEIQASPYLSVKDLTFSKRPSIINNQNWKTYQFSDYSIKYPADNLELVPSAVNVLLPQNIYFYYPNYKTHRYQDKRGLTRVRFIGFDLNYQIINYQSLEEAINTVLQNLKPQVKTISDPKKINRIVETSTTKQGWNLYFIEYSREKPLVGSEEKNWIQLLIEIPNEGYLNWAGYITFNEGKEFFKQIAETIQRTKAVTDLPSKFPEESEKTALSNQTVRKVKLYYFNRQYDPKVDTCNSAWFVEREIPFTETPIHDAINLLIGRKLTSEEIREGFETEFPHPEFKLRSASLKDGILTLDFPNIPGFTTGGSCRIGILESSIVNTAKQFSEVKEVKFTDDLIFQP